MTLPRDSEGPRSYRHVSSSTVAAITYERSTRTLGIRFQRGAEYRYFSVPETVYLEVALCGFQRAILQRSDTRCWVYVSAGTLDSLSGRDLYS